MNRYYLAYGSNLNLSEMEVRCPTSSVLCACTLNNYRLAFKGSADKYAYLTLEKCENSGVDVAIFEVTEYDEHKLDIYEGEMYHKEYIQVMIDDREIECFFYVMNDLYDYHLPRNSYFNRCLEGYSDFNFDESKLIEAWDYAKKNKPKKKKKIFPL